MTATAYGLLDLIQSHRVSAVIHVAARLGIAEALRKGPLPADRIARAVGADEGAMSRLLTALLTIGICSQSDTGAYSVTELGADLDGESPSSLKAWAIFEGDMLVKSWNGLLESVTSGRTAAQIAGVGNSFEFMARTPENVALFNAAMTDLTRLVMPEILRAYDFSHIIHLMDVGGGSGELLGSIVRKYPSMRGTVFDLPRCANLAQRHLEAAGVADRASFVAGDFFVEVPSMADAIVLKSVIHDWSDDQSLSILRNCRRALPAEGILLLIERVLPETPSTANEDRSHVMSDLNMLRGPGGRERTASGYHRLLADSGFAPKAIHPAGRFSVIEAIAS